MEITEKNIYQVIGKNIKYYRLYYSLNKEKLTQEKLAEKVGVTTTLIGNMESKNPKGGISIYTLYKISKVLDVPIDKFFELPPNQK